MHSLVPSPLPSFRYNSQNMEDWQSGRIVIVVFTWASSSSQISDSEVVNGGSLQIKTRTVNRNWSRIDPQVKTNVEAVLVHLISSRMQLVPYESWSSELVLIFRIPIPYTPGGGRTRSRALSAINDAMLCEIICIAVISCFLCSFWEC